MLARKMNFFDRRNVASEYKSDENDRDINLYADSICLDIIESNETLLTLK